MKEANDYDLMRKNYGERQARKIAQRLEEFHGAHNLEELRLGTGRPHELKGNLKGILAVDLMHPYRLLFEAANDPVPMKPDGGLDWSNVTEIRIKAIVDYHD